MWQRYGFGVAIGFAVIALFVDSRFFVNLAAFALFVNSTIAAYHFGIEQDWWEGFQTCSGAATVGSLDDLRAEILGAAVVRCDDMGWLFLGVSMAGWNVLYSAGLGAFALWLNKR
jgi:disulfide bond formation protein DsbB